MAQIPTNAQIREMEQAVERAQVRYANAKTAAGQTRSALSLQRAQQQLDDARRAARCMYCGNNRVFSIFAQE